MKILQFPLARISVAFFLGILFFQYYKPFSVIVFGSLIVCIGLLIILHLIIKKKNSFKIIFGILAILISFLIGVSTSIIHKETNTKNHYVNQIKDYEKTYLVELVVNEKLKTTTKNTRFISFIKRIDKKESFGKMILNIKNPNQITNIKTGTTLYVQGAVYKNKVPFNPNQFDYGKYLENKEIYAQIYTNGDKIKIGETSETIWTLFSNFRTEIIRNLEASNFKKNKLNVFIALLLGQQQDISPEILKDYQYAGAVHILSVSGLHVGFILMFISFLLKPIPNSKKGSIIKLFAILISLWIFGIIAGLSPSVIRSVTMFSFVAIGNHIRRTVNIFHTLLVSMLLILLFEPSFLFDVGFQLSYLALFFIVWLQPLLSDIWQPKNKIIGYFWDIITVSFAAQIGTMPLSIYYFHQFPGLFFITNIIVLPLIGLIMIVGLFTIIMACFNPVPSFIIKPIEFLIKNLNGIIHWIATFEDFIIKNISFTKEMLWTSYLLIILSILWIKKPGFKKLTLTLVSFIVLQGIYIFNKYKSANNDELIIFNTTKYSLISERNKNNVTIYSSDSIIKTLDSNLSVQSYLVGNFCEIKETKSLGNVLYFKNKKILIIDSSNVYLKNIKPDIVIITNSPKLNLERLFTDWKPKQVVVNGSNFKKYIQLWEATCRKEKIPFHNINEKGFYKL